MAVSGITSVFDNTGQYFPDDYNEGTARYNEAISLIDEAYKEQQYWLVIYNRAQQCGIRGYTVQEVTLQLEKVSQKLDNYKKILLEGGKSALSLDASGIKNVANQFKSS